MWTRPLQSPPKPRPRRGKFASASSTCSSQLQAPVELEEVQKEITVEVRLDDEDDWRQMINEAKRQHGVSEEIIPSTTQIVLSTGEHLEERFPNGYETIPADLLPLVVKMTFSEVLSTRNKETKACASSAPPSVEVCTLGEDTDSDQRFTVVGAILDSTGKQLRLAAYLDMKQQFAGEVSREQHPDPNCPGVRQEELASLQGLKMWCDDRGAGWIAMNGKKAKWFSIARYWSWRLAFLLARLQRDLWHAQSSQSKQSNGHGVKPCNAVSSSSCSRVSIGSAQSSGLPVETTQRTTHIDAKLENVTENPIEHETLQPRTLAGQERVVPTLQFESFGGISITDRPTMDGCLAAEANQLQQDALTTMAQPNTTEHDSELENLDEYNKRVTRKHRSRASAHHELAGVPRRKRPVARVSKGNRQTDRVCAKRLKASVESPSAQTVVVAQSTEVKNRRNSMRDRSVRIGAVQAIQSVTSRRKQQNAPAQEFLSVGEPARSEDRIRSSSTDATRQPLSNELNLPGNLRDEQESYTQIHDEAIAQEPNFRTREADHAVNRAWLDQFDEFANKYRVTGTTHSADEGPATNSFENVGDKAYAIGDRVRVRDKGEEWYYGSVTSVSPFLKVTIDGGSEGFTWDEVEQMQGLTTSCESIDGETLDKATAPSVSIPDAEDQIVGPTPPSPLPPSSRPPSPPPPMPSPPSPPALSPTTRQPPTPTPPTPLPSTTTPSALASAPERCSNEMIEIEVRLSFSGLLITRTRVRPTDTVSDLKRIVTAARVWPSGGQQLLLGSHVLQAAMTLTAAGVHDGATVTVTCVPLRWHDEVRGSHADVSDDGLTVSRRERLCKFNGALVIANGPMRSFCFQVIDNSARFGGGVEVGFSLLEPEALADDLPSSAVGLRHAWICDPFGEFHIYKGELHCLDLDFEAQGWDPEKLQNGDIVACRATAEGRMQIDINDCNVASWDVDIPPTVRLYPVLSLFGKTTAVKLIRTNDREIGMLGGA